MGFLFHRFAIVVLFIAAFSLAAFADGSHDRTQIGRTINISPDEQVSAATCFGCSIRVRGHVSGDVTAFGGSIVLEDQSEVDGDATTFGGDLRLDKAAKVNGDATVFGGRLRRDPEATVGGDVTNMGGRGWILLIFGAPIVIFGLFVWLVVWLIRRLTQPAVPAAV
jgi:cytoskeletal protein CcmA (bactofilin family)